MAVPDWIDEASAAWDRLSPDEQAHFEACHGRFLAPTLAERAPALLPIHLTPMRQRLRAAWERMYPTTPYDPAPEATSDPVFDPPKPPPEQDPGCEKGYRPSWAVPLSPRKPA